MHRALATPEILMEVFGIARKSGQFRERWSGSALVCKLWLEPVLDILWSKSWAIDLVKLLGWITGDQREEQSKREASFLTTPTPNEWQRFFYYSRRVVDLILYMTDDPSVGVNLSARICDTFASTRPTTIGFFPRMRTIYIEFMRSAGYMAQFIQPWIGPQLDDFFCLYCGSYGEEDPGWLPFSVFLRQQAPNVRSLSLGPEDSYDDWEFDGYPWETADVLAFIDGRDLVKLDVVVKSIAPDLIKALSNITKMKILGIRVASPEQVGPFKIPQSIMASLRCLELAMLPISTMTRILELSAGSPSLEELSYTTSDITQPLYELPAFCSLVLSSFPSLRQIFFGFAAIHLNSIKVQAFTPFSHLHRLQRFSIRFGRSRAQLEKDNLRSSLKTFIKGTQINVW